MNRDEKQGMITFVILVVALIIMLFTSGCFTRTVYVPAGQPVRLRQSVRSVKIWALDEAGKPVKGVIDLPEGWFVGPMKPTK